MISCFSAYGTGAAFAIRQTHRRHVGLRELARRAGYTMRLSWVGAENVFVTRCSFTSSIHAPGRTCAARRSGAPSVCASDANASGPEWYSGPVVRCTAFAVQQVELAEQREHDLRVGRACAARPSACRWCPTCRSSPRRRRSSAAIVGLGVGLAGEHVVPREAAGAARRRRTRRPPAPSGAGRAPRRRAAPARRRRRRASRRSCR